MKYFRMSYEEVVFKRSYLNVLLLNRSIPPFDTDSKDMDSNRREKSNGKKPSKQHHDIDRPISANDFFMGMMG